MKLQYLSYALIVLSTIALLFSLLSSQRIDEPGSKLSYEFVHFSYWVGMTLVAVFIILLLKLGCGVISGLALLLLTTIYIDTFFSFLYTRPIFREIYHAAQSAYVAKYGDVDPGLYPGHMETVAPGIYAASFSMITSSDISLVIAYIPSIYFVLYTLFAYLVLRKFCSNKIFALLGTILVLSWTLQPFGMYRGSFTLLPWMLMFLSILNLFVRKLPGDFSVILMLGLLLTFSHPGISLLMVLIFPFSAVLFAILVRFLCNNSSKMLRSDSLWIGALLMVIFFAWYMFRWMIPIISGVRRALSSLIELWIESPVTHTMGKFLIFTQKYRFVALLRTVIVGLGIFMPWSLFLYVIIEQRANISKRYNLPRISILVGGLIVLTSSSIPPLYTGWMLGNLLVLLLPWSAATTAFLMNLIYEHLSLKVKVESVKSEHGPNIGPLFQRGYHKVLLAFILMLVIFSFMVAPIIRWSAVSTMVQIPTCELHGLKFMAEYLPASEKIVVGGVGIGHGGTGYVMSDAVRFIYADRTDLFIDSIAPTIIRLDPEKALKYIRQYKIIAFSGYALTLNSKYVTEILIKELVNYILNFLNSDPTYNLIYSSNWPYYILVRS